MEELKLKQAAELHDIVKQLEEAKGSSVSAQVNDDTRFTCSKKAHPSIVNFRTVGKSF